MIAVVGGSGRLGRRVVAQLVATGQQLRVLCRDSRRANDLASAAVEVMDADVRDRDSLAAAVSGAEVVLSLVHGFLGGRGAGPREVDDDGNRNLVDAAARTGSTVLLMSASGASPTHPVDLFRAKYAAEQYLRASDVPWTIVRAPAYLETWLGILAKTAGTTGRPLIFGRGDQPIAFVSVRDVAAVVSAAAIDPGARGRTLELAGEPLTMTALARALQDARGWHGEPRHVPRAALRILSVGARPIRPAFARQNRTALAMDTGVPAAGRPGLRATTASRRTLDDVLADLAA